MASLKTTISRTLKCPICLELLSDPKQLSCSHSFCKACLDNMLTCSCQTETVNSLTCPICRSVTNVKNGDVMNLNTNVLLKSVVEDLRNSQQLLDCEVCQTGSKAVHFCQECEKNMCNECLENHNKWSPNLKHTVVFVKDIQERKFVGRKVGKVHYCQEHDASDGHQHICSDVCLTCKKFICIRCRMLLHEKEGHTVLATDEYKDSFQRKIELLQALGEEKATTIKTHLAVIESQMKRVTDHIDGTYVGITNVHEVSVKLLNENKLALVEQFKAKKGLLCQRLQKMKGDHERSVASLKSANVLLGSSLEVPLSGDVIAIHDSLSGKLQSLVYREDPDGQLVTDVGDRAEELTFTPDQQDPLSIGHCCVKYEKIRSVKLSGRMNSLTSSVDGRMAVGYCGGGIEFVSENGQFQETVLSDVKVCGARFLSDGGYVVLDVSNTITTYSPEYVKSDAKFVTLGPYEGGVGSLAVCSIDHIYVGYCKAKKIQSFHLGGGTAIREIDCNNFEPKQITCLDDSLIINHSTYTTIFGRDGVVKHSTKRSHVYPYSTITQDNSILIAWVNHDQGFVTVVKVTNSLKPVKEPSLAFNIEKSNVNWYFLQVFASGRVAFCTSNRLYILACPP